MTAFLAIVRHDLMLAFRSGGGALQGVLFFAIAVIIFAIAIGPDRTVMAQLAAPLLWAAALLATLMSLERIFQADFEDGSLDVLIETSEILELRVLAKAIAHWLSTCAPLIAATPALALLLNLPFDRFGPLVVALIVGTPALSLIGALGGALAVVVRRAGILMTILVAPLYLPTLIFGVAAASDAGEAAGAALLFLGATSLLALVVAPIAAASAIRANMS